MKRLICVHCEHWHRAWFHVFPGSRAGEERPTHETKVKFCTRFLGWGDSGFMLPRFCTGFYRLGRQWIHASQVLHRVLGWGDSGFMLPRFCTGF